MSKNGFDVFPTAYFYVCNANRNAEAFSGELIFSETLVPYNWNTSWIDEKLEEMITTLNSEDLPAIPVQSLISQFLMKPIIL